MLTRTTGRVIAAVAVIAGTIALASCSTSEAAPADRREGELTTVNAGFIPVTDVAALYLGEEKGFFEEAGIDLTINIGASGSALLPSVMSGEYDFAFSNMVSLLQARSQGLDVKIVGSGSSSTGVEGADVTMIHSDEYAASELEGKTVSVNARGNLLEMLGRIGIDAAGADSSKVKFIELPFSDAVTALESGQIDAMVGAEPFGTAAIAAGFPVISSPYLEMSDQSMMTSAYYTSADQLEEDPELYASLREAIDKSLKYAQENPDEVRAQLGKFTELDETVAESMILPSFSSEVSEEAVDIFSKFAVKYQLITEPIEASDLIADIKG
ncbi:ABC transporter substrate-binding protein [Microbacterium sp.]|uniref:ABC transporter substrate-binding protein n=1 Tax=Microbacterium sp. TaxID=51671 RepID=UPI002D12F5A8|nr:ABC transporter substrate-binding protein [Microbacterium sp.]HWK76274.1 ABC transporter substrate-binding protein [Microbacterium sp.]